MGTIPSYTIQRSLCQDTFLAAFDIRKWGEQTFDGKLTSDVGMANFSIRPASEIPELGPFENAEALIQFLTYRMHGYLNGPGGLLLDMKVHHERMKPLLGRAEAARFEVFEKLGLLTENEASKPFSVLIQPEILFHALPPLPVKSLSANLWQRLAPAL